MVNAAHPDEKWLYRVGGISALTLGIAYIIIIPLFAHVGAPPTGGRGLAQVPPRENHGLVDDPFALCPHRLPLPSCRVSAILRLGTGQQKCDAPRQRISGVVCRLRPCR